MLFDDCSFEFDTKFRRGTLFTANAQDYFTLSRNTFNWKSEVPPFVIGRPAYDNWLVSHAYKAWYIDLIDVTYTVAAMHQTDEHGVTSMQSSEVFACSNKYETSIT